MRPGHAPLARIEAAYQAGHIAALDDAQRCKSTAAPRWQSSEQKIPVHLDERAAWMRGYGQQFAYWGGDRHDEPGIDREALAASLARIDREYPRGLYGLSFDELAAQIARDLENK